MTEKIDEYEGVWICAEQRQGKLTELSRELLGGGRELADKLCVDLSAILLGCNINKLVNQLIAYGANKVYLVNHPLLEVYQSDVYAKVIVDIVDQHKPEIFLLGATAIGLDLAPRVAAKLETGLAAHVVGLEIGDKRQLRQIVPGFGGNAMAIVVSPIQRPQMATITPGVFKKIERDESRTGNIVEVSVDIREEDLRAKTVQIIEEIPREKSIEKAEVVIAGGWGMRMAGGFKLVEELADVLGGAVGGTRPAVDEGWIGENQLIGQSGKMIRPELYIGVGISGEMHHVVGILNSKFIVAVNKDQNAPIFNIADIGVVGDLLQILPLLITNLKKTLGK